jgi:uncharacterized protein (DUF305 family)
MSKPNVELKQNEPLESQDTHYLNASKLNAVFHSVLRQSSEYNFELPNNFADGIISHHQSQMAMMSRKCQTIKLKSCAICRCQFDRNTKILPTVGVIDSLREKSLCSL